MTAHEIIEQLLQRYEEYRVAELNFREENRAAKEAISSVFKRIRQEKAENDTAILECQKILADPARSDGARTAAGVRLEVLLTKRFLVTDEEKKMMNIAVGDVKEAYHQLGDKRKEFDAAHHQAKTALREMRDHVFGNNPGSENYGHTVQMLHERLVAALEEGK